MAGTHDEARRGAEGGHAGAVVAVGLAAACANFSSVFGE